MNANEAAVRSAYGAYETGDRALIESVLAEDFAFHAPPDPNLNRTRYFERCWPFHSARPKFTFEMICSQGDTVMVLYQATRDNGPPIRNVEVFTLRDTKITSVTVFFGP
jgi:ketosteroid isomerase-like protein